MVRPKDASTAFNLQDYFRNPDRYESKFEQYLPFLSMLINCIYWSTDSPHFVSVEAIKRLFSGTTPPRLRVVGDISCDVGGGVEINRRATDIGNPVYVYDPDTGATTDGVAGKGPVILAVSNLPAEVPIDSSRFFSNALLPFVKEMVTADYSADFDALRLSNTVRNAMILHRGKLTPKFRYLNEHI